MAMPQWVSREGAARRGSTKQTRQGKSRLASLPLLLHCSANWLTIKLTRQGTFTPSTFPFSFHPPSVTATPTAAPVQFEKVGAAAQKTNASGRQGAAGKRFGYRGAQVPRPASAGLAGEDSNGNGNGNGTASAGNSSNNTNNNNNNNGNTNVLVSNRK